VFPVNAGAWVLQNHRRVFTITHSLGLTSPSPLPRPRNFAEST
jgi:hypothetical protein